MAPITFHSYTDDRGDTITFKFDPDIAREPDPKWPNDSAVTVYHYYSSKSFHHSILLSLDVAMKRWRNDKQSSQPPIGKVMYTECMPSADCSGTEQKAQYIWRGWSHGEGYRRGWTKLPGDWTFAVEKDGCEARGRKRKWLAETTGPASMSSGGQTQGTQMI